MAISLLVDLLLPFRLKTDWRGGSHRRCGLRRHVWGMVGLADERERVYVRSRLAKR